jgi:hypothetical protein
MPRIAIILIILISTSIAAYSQGFDWQFSPRMPAASPDKFIGLEAGYNFGRSHGDIKLFEDLVECCKFANTSSNSFYVGITGEYWYSGNEALIAGVNYSFLNSIFKAPGSALLPGDTLLQTEYQFDSKMQFLNISAGYKRRLPNTHFNAAASISLSVPISNTYIFTESVISPSDFYFSTVPPSQERELANGSISGISTLTVSPVIQIGYDFDLGKGMYGWINLQTSYNLNSILTDDRWNILALGLNIRIYKGLPKPQ